MKVSRNLGRSTRRYRQVKMQAFRRDMERGAVCWLCGQPIDYTATPGTPDAYEADHFYPPHERPDLAEDITNLRPAHSSCNRSRGDKKVGPFALGKPSRQW